MTPAGSNRPGRRPTGSRRAHDTPRSRGSGRATERAARTRATASVQRPAPHSRDAQTAGLKDAAASAPRRGLAVTRRAVAVVAVVFILLFSYLNSLRVYFDQDERMAEARASIRAEQEQIAQLQDEKRRWDDPDYVKAQARIRLGWVVPGEVGYKVIGPDGKPLGSEPELESATTLPGAGQRQTWWERLLGSMRTADEPAPAPTPTAPEAGAATPSVAPTIKYRPSSRTTSPHASTAPQPSTTPRR